MSTSRSDDDIVRYSVKELLAEIRADVRAIDLKLDLKADRQRLHDLANEVHAIRMSQSAREPLIKEFRDTQTDISDLKAWRNRIAGAIALLGALLAYNIWPG